MPYAHSPGYTRLERETIGDVWHLEQQGNLLAVAVCRAAVEPRPEEKRAAVAGFTPASRLRLLKLLARIDWAAVGNCCFVTMTYPDECIEEDYRLRTQHRGQFVRDLLEYIGTPVSILWRVEWKTRLSGVHEGLLAPHMHLCVFTRRWLPKATLRKWWGRIIGHKEPLVWVRFRKGLRAAQYAAKYAAKEEQMGGLANSAYLNEARPGRRWGVLRRKALPTCPQRYLAGLSASEEQACQALAYQHLGKPHRGGFVLLTDDAANLFDRITGITQPPLALGDAAE